MDLLGLGKVTDNGLEVVKTVYPDLAQPGLQKVGQALGTVLDLGNTILLPLKLANANASVFVQHHMDKYRRKMLEIPEENICEVQPTIGLKILDELLKVTNEQIAELFINLLVNASDKERCKYAHPGFIDVINNLSADEAQIINKIYLNDEYVISLNLVKVEHGNDVKLDVGVNSLEDQVVLTFIENANFYLENLVKCGLIKEEDTYIEEDLPRYQLLESRISDLKAEVEKGLKEYQEKGELINSKLVLRKGSYPITSYGEMFLNSISIELAD